MEISVTINEQLTFSALKSCTCCPSPVLPYAKKNTIPDNRVERLVNLFQLCRQYIRKLSCKNIVAYFLLYGWKPLS